MRNEEITLLFQGPWKADSAANIAAARRVFPGAKVILSTWDTDVGSVFPDSMDEVVVSRDPGALPPYKFGDGAPPNNINRQILSTSAGLARVTTPYVAKMRTDCSLDSRAVADIYCAHNLPDRIVVSSVYTLHPEGIEAFQFHVSDWFQFGRSDQVRHYWDVAPMSVDEACWFDRQAHAPKSHYFARRYRSRFAPEQYISVAYGRGKGYRVPASIDDREVSVVAAYKRFLAHEFVVASPAELGLVFAKAAGPQASNYQFFNCVSSAKRRARAVSFMRQIDWALPWIKKAGCMPLVGKCLAFYR